MVLNYAIWYKFICDIALVFCSAFPQLDENMCCYE